MASIRPHSELCVCSSNNKTTARLLPPTTSSTKGVAWQEKEGTLLSSWMKICWTNKDWGQVNRWNTPPPSAIPTPLNHIRYPHLRESSFYVYVSSPAVAATVYLPAVSRDAGGGGGDGAEEDYGENIHFRSLANGETRRNSSGVGAQAEQWQRSRSTSSHLQIIYSLVWVDGPALPA